MTYSKYNFHGVYFYRNFGSEPFTHECQSSVNDFVIIKEATSTKLVVTKLTIASLPDWFKASLSPGKSIMHRGCEVESVLNMNDFRSKNSTFPLGDFLSSSIELLHVLWPSLQANESRKIYVSLIDWLSQSSTGSLL